LPKIEIIPAEAAEQPILANLLELYAHDFSEFHDLELGEDGRFGYRDLAIYWLAPNRYPFLIRVDGKLAGLALVKRNSELSADEPVWDIAEFFVVRKYRRHGVGTEIAHEVWRRFPGPWSVRVMQSNDSGRRFWEQAITAFTGRAVDSSSFERNGQQWHQFSFQSPPQRIS
jgi:predicted acetyltransferase